MEEIKIEDIKETKPKKIFNFKEYYNSNEEYRKRHIEKALTPVKCDCGMVVGRCNLSRHKKSKSHAKQILFELNKLV